MPLCPLGSWDPSCSAAAICQRVDRPEASNETSRGSSWRLFTEPTTNPCYTPTHPQMRAKEGLIEGYPELVSASFWAGIVLALMRLLVCRSLLLTGDRRRTTDKLMDALVHCSLSRLLCPKWGKLIKGPVLQSEP